MMIVTENRMDDVFKQCPCGKTNHNDLERMKRNLIQRTIFFFCQLNDIIVIMQM